jgi:putative transposase
MDHSACDAYVLLIEAAEKSWRRLDGHNQLPRIILGVRFTDGIEVVKAKAQAAAA